MRPCRRVLPWIPIFAISLFAALAQAQGSPANGKTIYDSLCQECHKEPPNAIALRAAGDYTKIQFAIANQVEMQRPAILALTVPQLTDIAAYLATFVAPAALNFQGLWWAAPANSESGWGVNLAHQGDTVFASWFTYDTAGRGWWLVVTAQKTATNTYSGKLYSTRGPAFNAVPWDPATVVPTEAGTATLTFTDASNGTFSYTIGAVSQNKAITREVFGALPTCTFGGTADLTTATNYQDLWWRKPAGSESGWGINLNQEGDTIFATWFTYDLDGSPLWLVVTAQKTGPNVYSGDLYRTSGARFDAFKAGDVVATKVGTATFTFTDGNNATFDYTVQLAGMASPATQSKPITREVFTAPGTACK
jgi:hypothetical protein